MTSTDTDTEKQNRAVVACRMNCKGCGKENFQLIDVNGITDKGFATYRKEQICSDCDTNQLLEFLPIYKDENLEDIVNEIIVEYREKVIKAEQESSGKNTKNKKVFINKYSGNGRLPLYESVVIKTIPTFVTIPENYIGNGDVAPKFFSSLDAGTGITYLPNGTIDTTTPLSYVFDSQEEFSEYLKLALRESYDSLFVKVEAIYRKYVNVEEHYYPIMAGDTIWSYFQDNFGYTHYLIFTGENASGKNSALLVFRYLGYRVFYIVSANAPNYYTAYGSQEEGQVTIAEDEAEDIGEDKDKRNILKAGYQTGGSVPKIDLEGGRTQDNWLVYGLKWFAMEELKIDRNTKGIVHRSLQMGFLTGDVPYNIKDVIKGGRDPDYQYLFDELIHIRKLLFAYRLLHHRDQIPMINLSVKGRTAELTSPLIRLFRNSPTARQKILDSLSQFIKDRSQTILNSFESKLCDSVQVLIDDRKRRLHHEGVTLDEPTNEDKELGEYTFTNESIKLRLIEDSEAEQDPEKKKMYYSAEIGAFGQAKITSVLKSKFKPKFPKPKKIGNRSLRLVEFNQSYLTRLRDSYQVPDKIEIVSKDGDLVAAVAAVAANRGIPDTPDKDLDSKESENHIKTNENISKKYDNSNNKSNINSPKDEDNGYITPSAATAATAATAVIFEYPPKCYRCGSTGFKTKEDYLTHCIQKHPGKAAYPGPADLKADNLTGQGMSWENK